MKEHPTYIEIGDPPRKGPSKDPRDPRGDGSGSSPGITAGGKRRKRRKRRKRTRRKSNSLIHKLFRLAGGRRRKR